MTRRFAVRSWCWVAVLFCVGCKSEAPKPVADAGQAAHVARRGTVTIPGLDAGPSVETPGPRDISFDPASCAPGSFRKDLSLGSIRLTVSGPSGDECLFKARWELEGGYEDMECSVPRKSGMVLIRSGVAPGRPPGTCRVVSKGNQLLDGY
ncbi:MAG: hypothetical protein Q8S33_30780 [Myxococcales bacterium]|nr:hypothetical protein [Myxococcales bacterium]